MPTKHPRHAITETPPVREALDELRSELNGERLDLAELVILGAGEKVSRIRADAGRREELRRRLAARVRRREIPIDAEAAEEVRRRGWARSV